MNYSRGGKGQSLGEKLFGQIYVPFQGQQQANRFF
jgi:hypothetical protein